MPTVQIDPVYFDDKFSKALGLVFQQRPHAFFIGGINSFSSTSNSKFGFYFSPAKKVL